MWEPRGHADMYGGIIGSPTTESSDLSVLFIHNQGFSTMCGHGIIALTKVALDTGILPITEPTTTIGIDTPAGQVMATASVFGLRKELIKTRLEVYIEVVRVSRRSMR